MTTENTSFIHKILLSSLHQDIIRSVTGWTIDSGWRVTSRSWNFMKTSEMAKSKGMQGRKQVTVFNYGSRAVVFLDEKPLSFTSSYKASDFDGPAHFSELGKYKLFADHIDHAGHCRSCV